MADINEDTLTKVSTDAAEEFVRSYYPALQSSRKNISSFYAPVVSSILFNGSSLADGASVQETFVNQMPGATYEIQSYDCQIINANYVSSDAPATTGKRHESKAATAAKTMTILVLVSGYVKFGEDRDTRDAEGSRGFSETFVLVPNPQAGAGPKGAGRRHWLIQSQNFRLVV